MRFVVTIPATYKPVSLQYETTADVNAEHAATEGTEGTDYTSVSGTLVFAVGETSKFIDVPIIAT